MGRFEDNGRIRVLTLSDAIGTYGGGERVARQLTTHLDPERFEAAFCVSRWEEPHDPVHDPALDELRNSGVEFLGLERGSRFDLGPWRRLVSFLREREVDVLHSHMFGSNVWGALVASRAGVPVFVAHEHTWSYEGQPVRKFLDRHLIARRSDAFVAVSRQDQRRMVEIEHVPEPKTRFIPNGIPPPPPPDPDNDIRAELGIGPEQPVAGIVAVMRPQKAYDVLLRAAASMREAVPGLKVLVVGAGKAEKSDVGLDYELGVHRLASELGLEGTVEFLGLRNDVPDVLAALDVAVLSSDYEGSPLSVLEYMEAGKPVVSTRVGGVPDLVEDGVTGILVEPQDPEALASAVVSLLRDPERTKAMGEAGRERRRSEFSIEATVRKVEDLYEELIAAKGRGGRG
jgi:glycosyltransferase involved in cell wall biosynthesis